MAIPDKRLRDRQRLVDAAVEELRRQLGADAVRQVGTHVEVEGVFKVARLLEAMVRVACTDQGHVFDALVDTIADAARIDTGIEPTEEDFERFHEIADEAAKAVYGAILWQLDPLP